MRREVIAVRVDKIGLRLDFTCPNRDGNVAVGECIYRNNASHTPAKYQPSMAVTEQLEQGAASIHRRHQAERFIAYFHSCSNSDDAIERIEKLYREALAFPGVVGLAIATRPDCLADATLDLYAPALRRSPSHFHRRAGLVGAQARHAQRDSARTDTTPRLARPALYKAQISD